MASCRKGARRKWRVIILAEICKDWCACCAKGVSGVEKVTLFVEATHFLLLPTTNWKEIRRAEHLIKKYATSCFKPSIKKDIRFWRLSFVSNILVVSQQNTARSLFFSFSRRLAALFFPPEFRPPPAWLCLGARGALSTRGISFTHLLLPAPCQSYGGLSKIHPAFV